MLIITVDETEGLGWELTQILAHGFAGKTKFIMHPNLAEDEKAKIAIALGTAIEAGDLARLRGLDLAPSGQVRAYLGAASGATYRCMLGWMLQR